MHGDFNQAGEEYEMLPVGGNPGHYQTLETDAARFFENLQRHLCAKWANNYQSSEFKRWSATLDCLRSFLYQARRMGSHATQLCRYIPQPEQMVGVSGKEALADFEALLYFGRSALDRLTFAIAKQTYGQECDKFNRLSNVLKNYEKNDKRAEQAKTLVDLTLPEFQGILIDNKNGKTGLRSLLAHRRSTGESMTHVFIVHRLANGSILRFDFEIEQVGVLSTSYTLNRAIPFIILNLLSLYSEFDRELKVEACQPTWQPRCIRLSSFIDSTGKGPQFSTLRMNACDTEIISHPVKADLFVHAEQVSR